MTSIKYLFIFYVSNLRNNYGILINIHKSDWSRLELTSCILRYWRSLLNGCVFMIRCKIISWWNRGIIYTMWGQKKNEIIAFREIFNPWVKFFNFILFLHFLHSSNVLNSVVPNMGCTPHKWGVGGFEFLGEGIANLLLTYSLPVFFSFFWEKVIL